MLLSWQPPPTEYINGHLRHYTLHYVEHETSLSQTATATTTTIQISGLHPHFTYTIKVRAETISPGPFSIEQSLQLEEDGMFSTSVNKG